MVKFELTKAGTPTCNFEAAKQELTARTEPYNNVVFTEDTKADAKKLVAELRKEKKGIEEALKGIKAEYLKPWNEFNTKVSELLGLYDAPIFNINEQVEAFELRRKQEKQELCRSIYVELVPEEDLQQIIPYARIRNPKWDNATFKEGDIRKEIMERKVASKEALATIKAMNSEKEQEAIEKYMISYNLADAIVFLNNYEQQKREILARKQEEDAKAHDEAIKAQARAELEAEQKQAEQIEQAKADLLESFIPECDDVEAAEYSYTIRLTPSEKEALEKYMNSIGVEFEELNF